MRETIGFNKERGDSVNLMNTPFLVEQENVVELPLWKQPEVRELARTLGWPLGISLAVALLLLGLVRPTLKARGAPKAVPAAGLQVDAIESESLERPALPAPEQVALPVKELPPTPEQKRLEDARTLARDNPVAVANIIKTWVNGE